MINYTRMTHLWKLELHNGSKGRIMRNVPIRTISSDSLEALALMMENKPEYVCWWLAMVASPVYLRVG